MPAFPLNKWLAVQLASIDRRLSSTDVRVFGRLLYHHNSKTNACYPGHALLALALGCSERTIRQSVSKLEETDYLVSLKHQGRNGTNLYRFNFPSGIKEYREQEELMLSSRKNVAAKHMNKHMNKQGREQQRKKYKIRHIAPSRIDIGLEGKQREKLQNVFVSNFSNAEEGWNIFMQLDAQSLKEIEKKYFEKRMSLEYAVQALLQAVG